MRLIALLALIATPALSQSWVTRANDRLLSAQELAQSLTGKPLVFFDNSTSVFSTDGRYAYTYEGGGTWLGHYTVNKDSTACVTFVTGVTRCDLYVRNAERLVLITEDGQRFPVRP